MRSRLGFGYTLRWLGCVLLLLVLVGSGRAQVFDFMPPQKAPVLFNPSWVGSSDRIRVDLFARNQWFNLKSPYRTIGLSSDLKFGVYGDHALGLSLYSDIQGDNIIQHTAGHLYYAYKVDVTYALRLRIGAGVGAIMKSANYNRLVFPDMMQENPGARSAVIYDERRRFVPDFSFGLSGDASDWYFGLSVHHMAEPRFMSRKTSVGIRDVKLDRKLTLYVSHVFNPFALYRFKEPLYIEPMLIVSHTGSYESIRNNHLAVALGCMVEYYGISASLWLKETIFYRSHSAVASIGWSGRSWGLMYSYSIGFFEQKFQGLNASVHEIGLRFKIPYPRIPGFSPSTRSSGKMLRYSRKRSMANRRRGR